VLSGSVRNLPALAAELGVAGTCSDERVLGLALARWGEETLTRLRGSFTLVFWDSGSRTGFLAVDQLGAGALFLHESDGRLSFATELGCLLRLLARRPAPDRENVVQWLSDGHLDLGETLFEGIRRLEGGHLVRLEGGAWSKLPYWTPRYETPERLTPADASALLRAELERAVAERLTEPRATGLLVSGGIDSAAVAAIACGADSASHRLRAYSLLFPEHPQADESGHVELLTRELQLPWVTTQVHVGSAMAASLEYQQAWGLPAASPTLFFYLPMLRRAAADGIAVALDGEGGDELFGCSGYLIADRMRRGDAWGALSLARRFPGVGEQSRSRAVRRLLTEFGVKGLAPYRLHRAMQTQFGPRRYAPHWLTPVGAAAYLGRRDKWAWKRRPGPRWWAFLADLLTAWRERTGAHDFFRGRSALAGLETRHPLFDDLDLIELVLRLPPELAFDARLTRPLLRMALAGRLPEQIRLRSDKGEFSALLVGALSGPDRTIVTSLLTASDAAIREYVDPGRVRVLLEAPRGRRHFLWAQQVWRFATTESWLRSQENPASPLRVLRETMVSAA
jgi:asparagine synthase (glutamine-hydrolysing)